MRTVTVDEAESQLSKILEEVEAGEQIVIARAGKPVAVLSPFRATTEPRRLGQFAGEVEIAIDFDQLPEGIRAGFEGGAR